jgi:DNA modification methylase
MVAVFRECRRVLRDDGTLWLNLGDSYASGVNGRSAADTKAMGNDDRTFRDKPFSTVGNGLKPKDLCMIPARVALALQADGWWLRSDIIWHKPSPMPESVTDRPTSAHEHVFLLTKSARYFYDNEAVREAASEKNIGEPITAGRQHKQEAMGRTVGTLGTNFGNGSRNRRNVWTIASERNSYETFCEWLANKIADDDTELYKALTNEFLDASNKKSDIWTIATESYKEAHFATFPTKLVEPCILAGTSARGCCPCGAPWERVVERSRSFESGSGKAGNLPKGKNGPSLQGGGETLDVRRGPVVHSTTTGWRPTCDCPPADPQPAIVLDPFFGSGTVGAVAVETGRHYLGIELNEEYIELARRRIGAAQPALIAKGLE